MIAAKRGLAAVTDIKEVYLDSPTSDKHGEHSAKATMGTARSGRQAGENGDDTSCSHLDIRIGIRQEGGSTVGRFRKGNTNRDQRSKCGGAATTNHSKFASWKSVRIKFGGMEAECTYRLCQRGNQRRAYPQLFRRKRRKPRWYHSCAGRALFRRFCAILDGGASVDD